MEPSNRSERACAKVRRCFGALPTGRTAHQAISPSHWKTGDRSVILMCGGESAAKADTEAAVWTPLDEGSRQVRRVIDAHLRV